jgi:hypothetical protein
MVPPCNVAPNNKSSAQSSMPPMGEASTLSARPRAATAGQTAAQDKREAQAQTKTKTPAPAHLSPAAEVAIRLLPGNDVRGACCLRSTWWRD